MKKLILLLAIFTLFYQSIIAQTGGINFQGVARNATGAVLANQKINLKFSIIKTSETGTVEYTETKETTTNAQGVFAVVVGEVNATSFATVDWKVTPKFLKVEMDAAGGTSFITMGTTRLQNVPFAYYANGVNANNIDGAVPVSKGGTGALDAATARTNLGAESVTNKSLDITADANSISKYPSVKIIKDYVDSRTASGVLTNTDLVVSSINGLKLGIGDRYNNTTNIYLGRNTNKSLGTGTNNFAVFSSALRLNLHGSDNFAVGVGALENNGYGYNNFAVGSSALTNNDNGSNNFAVGSLALYNNTTGSNNIALGINSLRENSTGSNNIAYGFRTLTRNTTGNNNVALGESALYYNSSGGRNVAVGDSSLLNNTTGVQNVAIGTQSLFSNTTGNYNFARGLWSLYSNTTGFSNIANGTNSMRENTTGSNNVAIGESSLAGSNGSFNVAIGLNAGNGNGTGGNNIYIGNNSLPNSTNPSNTITLGNKYITTLRVAVTSITALSDKRDKTDIVNISEGLEFIRKLRPVSFTWNTRDKAKVGIKSVGFIAQDLLALQKNSAIGDNLDLVSQDNPEKLEARYNNLLPVIVKAIQEVSAEKDEEIAELKARIQSLEVLIKTVLDSEKPK